MKTSKNIRRAILGCVVVLIGLVLLRSSSSAPKSTAHAACLSLVAALRSGDQQKLQSVTTERGLAELQTARRDPRIGSFPRLANRIEAEWIEDQPLEFLDSNRGFTRVWSDSSTWFRVAPAPLEHEGMAIGTSKEGIQFQRTPQGCKIDGYKPTDEANYKSYRRALNVRYQARATLAKTQQS